ncbi:hypothetical protein Jann_1308 [Jannaschia sp. CCS1]|nr:hypothetical protein Jann_1308 [Jannaschia sp. CCS1]
MSRPATEITVADVYIALGMSWTGPEDGEDNPPDCKIEAALHGVVDRAMQKAETVLVDELAIVTISDLSNGLGRS